MNKQKEITLLVINRNYKIDKEGNLFKNKREIKGSVGNRGYKSFSFRNKKGETHPIFFHRLQAYEKFGDKIFEKDIVVRHLNGDSLDNSWDNIDIGNNSDNMMDIPKEIRIKSATNASRKMQNSIRPYEERCLIYQDLNKGITYKDISEKYKIPKGTLSFMKNKSIEYKEFIGK